MKNLIKLYYIFYYLRALITRHAERAALKQNLCGGMVYPKNTLESPQDLRSEVRVLPSSVIHYDIKKKATIPL